MAHSNDLDFFNRIPVAGLLVNKIGRPNFIYNLKFLSLVGYTDAQMSEIFIKDYTKVFDEEDVKTLRQKLKGLLPRCFMTSPRCKETRINNLAIRRKRLYQLLKIYMRKEKLSPIREQIRGISRMIWSVHSKDDCKSLRFRSGRKV